MQYYATLPLIGGETALADNFLIIIREDLNHLIH